MSLLRQTYPQIISEKYTDWYDFWAVGVIRDFLLEDANEKRLSTNDWSFLGTRQEEIDTDARCFQHAGATNHTTLLSLCFQVD